MMNIKLMQRLDTAELDIATLKNNYKDLEARVSENEDKINQNDDEIHDIDYRVTNDGKDITALDISVRKMFSSKVDKTSVDQISL